MTKGIASSFIKISKSLKPNDPRSKMYPYVYVVAAKNDKDEMEYIHLYTTSSTLLNNFTRQLGHGDRYEDGKPVIDYSFNDGEEETVPTKAKSKIKAT